MRDGDWKLVELCEFGQKELYNLHDDIGETTDLSKSTPDKTAELKAKLATWQSKMQAPIRENSKGKLMQRLIFILLICVQLLNGITAPRVCADDPQRDIYAKDNLVAWCIVPFDAKQRGPAERAEMLSKLGINHVAYDWRQEHIASFEEEILQYKKHNLNYFAFWSWHDAMEPLIKKHGIHPQIWTMMINSNKTTQEEKVAEAVQGLLPLVNKTKALGCKLAIYNHGGWAGTPENMVAVAKILRDQHNANHVGVVYNFHHGHEHMATFETSFASMLPYLHCVNINGMDDAETVAAGKNKIIPVGSGKHEVGMLKVVQDSGYKGRIGILDHRNELDSELSLQQNLDGLSAVKARL